MDWSAFYFFVFGLGIKIWSEKSANIYVFEVDFRRAKNEKLQNFETAVVSVTKSQKSP